MSIQVLPPSVVDQIAAGEVVERPVNLVKELVENAIDAAATEIEVEFSQGGRHVSVRDNGCGIAKRDLPQAFARHATSKISHYDDLWKLQTYGFRGEALASIGAVSRLTITSRERNSESAHRMGSHFGVLQEMEQVGGSFGTTVEVNELFANVPARLKFLKAESSESGQIRHMLKAMALTRPEINFRVKSQGKLLHVWPAVTGRLERAQQILDLKEMYGAQNSLEGMTVELAFSSPNDAAKNSRQIWIFAQNRWVQDKTVQAATMEAYRNLLMHGEYPTIAIWLSTDPAEVDVNIHPTKSQVKFRNAHNVFRLVEHTLRQALEQAPWLASLLPGTNKSQPQPVFFAAPEPMNFQFQEAQFQRTQYSQKTLPATTVMDQLRSYSLRPAASELTAALPPSLGGSSDIEQIQQQARWADLQVLGQAHLTYIVAQSREAVLFVDQHAAHERVAFERLMRDWRDGRVETQNFLVPLNLDMDEDQVQALLSRQMDFEKMGITIEQAGPQTLYISSGPALVGDLGIVKGLTQAAQEILEKGGSFAVEHVVNHIFATMACHSVVRAGQALSHEQMRELLIQMDEFPLSSFCPHGRPVFVEYRLAQLERDFGRIF